ncbi:shTK domain protein [Ostertagia ostertagi]
MQVNQQSCCISFAFSSSSALRYTTETTPCLGPGSPLTIAGPANNNGKSLKAGGGSATNTNQGKNLPLLNSSDQEVEWLLNKIRQSFGIRDSPNPPPYILRNGEMECKDYNTSCPENERNGLCVYDIVRWDCPKSCNVCGCTDILSQPRCSWFKEKGYCLKALHNNRTKMWCPKTCEFCQP